MICMHSMKIAGRVLLFLAFVLSVFRAEAQEQDSVPSTEYVYLLNADEIRFEKWINPDAERLIGNVVFRHDSMYMYCDSALFYQKSNSFNAYHNVRVEQGDTLFLYGDSMFYDGNTRLVRVRDNVRLENNGMVLLTDSLNFDRNTGLGWFFRGGTLMDGESTLISQYGQFDTNTKQASFRDGVSLESPDYDILTDTLDYNTATHIAVLSSPSDVKSDGTLISTSNGSFNTDTGFALLLDRSVVVREGDQLKMTGDSLVVERDNGLVRGYGDVLINDYKDKIDISGEYVFYDQNIDSAVVTGWALVVEYSSGDSLYLHSDSIIMASMTNVDSLFVTVNDTVYPSDAAYPASLLNDSVPADSLLPVISGHRELASVDTTVIRHIRAYHKARIYRTDLQAVADSIQYSTADSTLTMFYDPIVWSESQQILGEKIIVYLNDSTVDWAHIIGQSLFVQWKDSVHFNQIAGRETRAWFKNGELDRARIKGNVECVFYPEDDSVMIGMNTLAASDMEVYFRDGTVDRIKVTGRSNGVMYPMSQLENDKMYLSNFNWFDFIRPIDPEDVFYWREKREDQKLKKNAMSREIPLPKLKNRK